MAAGVDGIVAGPGVTPLQRGFTFYYTDKHKAAAETNGNSVERVASFRTAEGFWRVYNHMLRPHQLREGEGREYQLFVEGVKPSGEDPSNSKGGRLSVRCPPGLTSRYWEELVIAFVGEQIDGGEDEVCGVIVSPRSSGDVISIWNRHAGNRDFQVKLVRRLKALWELPPFVPMDYARHRPESGQGGGGGTEGGGERKGAWRAARVFGAGGGGGAHGGREGGYSKNLGRDRGERGMFERGERSAEGGGRREAWLSRERAGSADKGEWRSRGEAW
ncbi:eukaryotic translation initiation factor 4e type 2 [Nannochloropsis gaditana]|uniref:Eukaryotic translation initiation factor 4e type 2 n=1 Tax=Nannochloropsis gaditana TaxID=72520 RepID=W7TL35_9STRA|nr:eukaryotic translation initiation factor 4e type 2 [Nannochloropsis gaditana]